MNSFSSNLRRMSPEKQEYVLRGLLFHLIHVSRSDSMVRLLTELGFLEAKSQAGLIYELAGDFMHASKALPDTHQHVRIFKLLEEAIRRDIHFIERHPDTLFQCLWNSCWWYDNPQSTRHYNAPPAGWSQGRPPWNMPGPKLWRLLERWRLEKKSYQPGLAWARLRRPMAPLGTAQDKVLSGHKAGIESLACSPDGSRVYSVSADGDIKHWDIITGKQVEQKTIDITVPLFSISKDCRLIAWVNEADTHVMDIHSGVTQSACRGQEGEIRYLIISPDGKYLATGADDHLIRIWDIQSGTQLPHVMRHDDEIECLAFSPDGRWLASGGYDYSLRLWDWNSGRQITSFLFDNVSPSCVAFTGDGSSIIIATSDAHLRLLRISDGVDFVFNREHNLWINCLCISPDGSLIATGSGDRSIRVWQPYKKDSIRVLLEHEEEVNAISFLPDGHTLISGSDDGSIRLFSLSRCISHGDLKYQNEHVMKMAIHDNKDVVATGTIDGKIHIWDARSGITLAECEGHENEITSMKISHNCSCIVSGSTDKTVRTWDPLTGRQFLCLHKHKQAVNCVDISPDASMIASGSDDCRVYIWSTGGKILWQLDKSETPVERVAFSPDGMALLVKSWDEILRIWRFKPKLHLIELRQPSKDRGSFGGSAAIYTLGGKRVIGTMGRHIYVWDSMNGKLLKDVGHKADVRRLIVSDDGKRFVTQYDDNTVRLWDSFSLAYHEQIKGCGDLGAIVEGIERYPWQATYDEIEVIIESALSSKKAYMPLNKVDQCIMLPSGKRWACLRMGKIYFFSIEKL